MSAVISTLPYSVGFFLGGGINEVIRVENAEHKMCLAHSKHLVIASLCPTSWIWILALN